ncbi:hypothetical protein [Winogradskyella luteola]|uniref:Uncharacterized protein n=1 Tax=Winogradskyella luteola TaxID=2828330 RepID=A0A9X1F8Q0_9FLAO|nr:hypothetical protein [Winogradskyella luteola]MBV7269151.1 hypothetical protein [Winogradskyella luteola]
MSDKLPNSQPNDEIDLVQLFKYIGKAFEMFFRFIANIFKTIFSAFVYSLKPLVNNFKIVSITIMIAAVTGVIIDSYKPSVYMSDMLVKPYFESKYQLANDIDYFNALISSNNHSELANKFQIDTTDAKELIGFEIEIGPETQNDLIIQYDEYISSIDSTLAIDITYDDYVLNRDILAGKVFSIIAKSHKKDIFKSLEKGFINTFENDYSKKLKRLRDSALYSEKLSYQKELMNIDSLQNLYLNVLKTESENGKLNLGSGTLFPLIQEKTQTREYDLFQEELKIRGKLRVLDEKLIVESDYYDILSGFEEVGTKESNIQNKSSIIFPILALALLVLAFIFLKVFKFIRDYEHK